MEKIAIIHNITVNGLTGTIVISKGRCRKKSDVGVSFPNPEQLPEDHLHHMSVPTCSFKGEDPLNQRMWDLYRKVQVTHMKALLDFAVELGLVPSGDWRYSQTAGCSCGCSPGFVCGEHRHSPWDYRVDFVDKDKVHLLYERPNEVKP
jgi:hypothetical protein